MKGFCPVPTGVDTKICTVVHFSTQIQFKQSDNTTKLTDTMLTWGIVARLILCITGIKTGEIVVAMVCAGQ